MTITEEQPTFQSLNGTSPYIFLTETGEYGGGNVAFRTHPNRIYRENIWSLVAGESVELVDGEPTNRVYKTQLTSNEVKNLFTWDEGVAILEGTASVDPADELFEAKEMVRRTMSILGFRDKEGGISAQDPVDGYAALIGAVAAAGWVSTERYEELLPGKLLRVV